MGSVSYRVSVRSVSYRVLVGSEGVGVSVLQSHTHPHSSLVLKVVVALRSMIAVCVVCVVCMVCV